MNVRIVKKALEYVLQKYLQRMVDEVVTRLGRGPGETLAHGERTLVIDTTISLSDLLEQIHGQAACPLSAGDKALMVVHRRILGLLARLGVEPIQQTSGRADFHLHEPVRVVPTSDNFEDDGLILEVVRTGYVAGNRVVRPALVSVLKYVPKPSEPNTNDEGGISNGTQEED